MLTKPPAQVQLHSLRQGCKNSSKPNTNNLHVKFYTQIKNSSKPNTNNLHVKFYTQIKK